MYGKRLKELRNAKKKTQAEVVAQIKGKPSTYSQWENERRVPNLNEAIKLAKYFKVSIDYIAGMTDEKQPKIALERLQDLQDIHDLLGLTIEDLTP